jgi:hypothetical protein
LISVTLSDRLGKFDRYMACLPACRTPLLMSLNSGLPFGIVGVNLGRGNINDRAIGLRCQRFCPLTFARSG